MYLEVYRTGRTEEIVKRAHKHIIMADEGEEMPESTKKSAVEWESFSAGLTVPTNIKYTMIRFDIVGKARNRATFIKHAAPQIRQAINEIAEACGLEPVFNL